jgi:NAD(P)H-hydrate epimerase
MSRSLTREQAREIDRRAIDECGMSSLQLMENASRGAVDFLERLGIAGPVLICCGPGNNGGDGLAMARHLDLRSHAVRVALWGADAKLSADAAANLRTLRCCDVSIERDPAPDRLAALTRGVDWIVDALFGTGFHGAMRAPFGEVIEQLNAEQANRLAVDIPSGLDANTGAPAQPTFRADHTVTFVAPKVGFASPAAKAFLGTVHVADIGAPRRLVESILNDA